MKYSLDCKKTFNKTYLFWLSNFIRSKVFSLSNNLVKDKNDLLVIMEELKNDNCSIEELNNITKRIRKIGVDGIHVYFIPLEKFYFFMKEYGANSMKEIDEELLSDFLISYTSQLSDATKKNYRIALLSFFAYIDKQNEDDKGDSYNFGIELKNWGGLSGKGGTKLPSYMKEEEIKRFIEAINEYPFRADVAARNKLIIKIILYTGIRVNEAINLKIKNFVKEDSNYILQVSGKGNKPRVVMIKESNIKDVLKQWLEIRNSNSSYLFHNKKGKLLAQAYISKNVEKILISAGIRKEKNGAHMLRHTFATMLYQKSHDLVLVQESLGHADINTSRIYTHFDKEKLKKTTDIF